jgi:hypothetical protein
MLQVQERPIALPLGAERPALPQAQERPVAVPQEQPANFTEGSKLLHDTFKHLTTLSTGSILLMVTLIQNLFKGKEISGTILIGLAFACFIVAMLSATGLMIIIGDQLRGREFYQRLPASIWTRRFFCRFFQSELRLGAVFISICVPSFLLGISALALFAFMNFN